MGFFKQSLSIAAVALALTLPTGQAGAGAGAPFAETCRHFDNRARFKPRDADAGLLAVLAEGCSAALRQVQDDSGSRDAATLGQTYLARLEEFRALTISILLERRQAMRPAQIGAAGATMRRIGLTETGEYLIARHMGLLGAHDDWAAATGFRMTQQR